MSTQKPNENKDPEVAIEQALGRTEFFIEKHGKKLLIFFVALVVVVGAYFAYTNLYVAPRAVKASAAMFDAQMLFERDSFAVALAGDGVSLGFEDIISEYSGTPQANLAAHYAGICCLKTAQFDRAISFFSQFDPTKNNVGEILAAQNTGLMGDCYVEMGQADKGVELYVKAAKSSANAATAPVFLQKAAMVNLANGKAAAAIEQLQTIKSEYPASIIARDVDKYIALAEQQL